MSKKWATLLMLVVGLLVVSPAQATTTHEVLASLKSKPVFVASGAEGTTKETAGEIEGQLSGGDNIVIAILPEGSGSPEALAQEIDRATKGQHIIGLSVGSEVYATSTIMPASEAVSLMHRAKDVSSSTPETMITFIRDVHRWQSEHPNLAASKPAGKKEGSFSSIIFVILIVMILVGVVGVMTLRSMSSPARTESGFSGSPHSIRDLLKEIMTESGRVESESLRALIKKVCRDTNQYFIRHSDQGELEKDVEVFTKHLISVKNILKTYIDIQQEPDYYNDPQTLLRQGQEAINNFSIFVVDSIKRGRRSELASFTVDTQILSAQRYR